MNMERLMKQWMQSFSSLKGALPGRVKRSSTCPEQDSAARADAVEDAQEDAIDQPPSRVSSGQISGTAPPSESAADPVVEPPVSLGAQSYKESRLRKFEGILSRGFVDLQALEAVRPGQIYLTQSALQAMTVYVAHAHRMY